MAIGVLDPKSGLDSRPDTSYTDNIVPHLNAWSANGERCALVTLVGVDGNAPRAVGAQMAVAESGRWAGYISGGCLEQAIALEALDVIKLGRPRLVRYGKGSPYFDIRLPCGSGLDVFIQPFSGKQLIGEMECRLAERESFALHIDMTSGASGLEALPNGFSKDTQSVRNGDAFYRVYTPSIRCLIVGGSPIAISLAELAACSGFDVIFHAPDLETLPPLPPGIVVYPISRRPPFPTDGWTAAILAFHDHDQEMPAFSELLGSPCFFIGAIGSRNAQEARKLALSESGFSDAAIARIRSPAGLVPGLKTAPYVALSILTEVVAAAREQHLLS